MIDQHALQAAMHRDYMAFREILPDLLQTHAGMFALMREERVVQFFHSDDDAGLHGKEAFDDGVFSVFEISDQVTAPILPEAVVAEAIETAPSQGNVIPRPVTAAKYAPRTIVFASQKGGAAKTTLCGHVAVQAERAGAGPVALIDTDPQGSLAAWWNARESETPLFVQTHVGQLAADLNALGEQGIETVFIDTPPTVTEAITEVVGYADLVVIPTRPSPHDLHAVSATIDIVEGRNKPLIFTLNGATARAAVTRDATEALSRRGIVAPVTVHQRIDYVSSMVSGQTVMEMNERSSAAKEIMALWEYIATRLEDIERQSNDRQDTVAPVPVERGRGFGRRVTPGRFGKRIS